jgi:3-phenylpropionate/trans-cinnamate dioxygenase ferredoxin subunit
MTTLAFDDLVPGRPVAVEVDGKPVCVARVGDEVFAVSNICTHSYAELSEGEVRNFSIECWLHGADFDLRTGEALTLPATEPLETFLVARDGNEITITQGTKEN